MFKSNWDHTTATDVSSDGLTATELLSTNWQTTAAVGLTVASGGVLGAISLVAFPAQTIGAGAAIGALAYTGKRRADGKSALPFTGGKSDKSESTGEQAEAAA